MRQLRLSWMLISTNSDVLLEKNFVVTATFERQAKPMIFFLSKPVCANYILKVDFFSEKIL